jgi:hypothetical protein
MVDGEDAISGTDAKSGSASIVSNTPESVVRGTCRIVSPYQISVVLSSVRNGQAIIASWRNPRTATRFVMGQRLHAGKAGHARKLDRGRPVVKPGARET